VLHACIADKETHFFIAFRKSYMQGFWGFVDVGKVRDLFFIFHFLIFPGKTLRPFKICGTWTRNNLSALAAPFGTSPLWDDACICVHYTSWHDMTTGQRACLYPRLQQHLDPLGWSRQKYVVGFPMGFRFWKLYSGKARHKSKVTLRGFAHG
jgi:hypothetical protein